MEVVRYLKGARVDRPPYNIIRKFVTRLKVSAPANKKWSYLCVRVWEWYARTPLTDNEIIRLYYQHEKDSPEKRDILKSVAKHEAAMRKLQKAEEKQQRELQKRQEDRETFIMPADALKAIAEL